MFNSLRDRLARRPGGEHLPGPVSALDTLDLASLAEELGDLGRLDLPAAPRERTWALVRTELGRQEARGAFGRASGRAGRHFGRLALGGVVLIVAATLGAVGLSGGFGDSDRIADSPSTSGFQVAAGGSTTDTQAPSTTGTSLEPGTSSSLGPVSTSAPSTEPPSIGSTDTTSNHGSDSTVPATSPRPHTSTTAAPGTTTTAGDQVMTSEQRENSASTVAMSLGEKIVRGNLSGAEALVTGRAQSDLVHMRATLHEPFGYRVVWAEATSTGVRVLMEMRDRVPGSAGDGSVETTFPMYYLDMQVDGDDSMVVTRISRALAQ